jgi:hypothetical protein
MVIGPFSNANDSELLKSPYPPEIETNLQASYSGAFGPISWRRTALSLQGSLDLSSELAGRDGVGTLAYALQYVWAPAPTDVYLSVAHQGGVVAWMNDEIVIHHHGVHRPSGEDGSRGLGRLQEGWNRLLLKLESFTGDSTFQFRLLHLDSGPLPDLRFSDSPEDGIKGTAAPKANIAGASRLPGLQNP